MFLAGLMLLVLTFGALYLGGAIYDAGEKRSIDTFFFQPNNLSADRPGELLTAAEMGESRILNMLVDRYVTEYFYVIPDRENIARRTRSDSVLARLSGGDVFRTWQNTVANDVTALMRLPLSQRLSEKNRRSHGKTHQQIRQRCHDLRTRSHRRHIHRRTKLSHHQQIHRAVHRLQKQRSQHRRHKSQQRFHDISFCKITGHPSFPPVKNGLNKRKRNAFHLIQPVILL